MADTQPKLTTADTNTLRGVRDLPLVSASVLADLHKVAPSTASRHLARLEKCGLVEGAEMGAAFPEAKRYRLTPAGAGRFLEPEIYFHLPRQINTLAYFLPAVEWFYRLAVLLPRWANTGQLQMFHWRFSEGVDAMVHYDNGTVAFLWSGPWQNRKKLQARIDTLGNSASVTGGWPALICVIASDHWQFHLASEVITSFGIEKKTLLVCAETQTTSAIPELVGSSKLLSLPPRLGSTADTVSAQLPRMMRDVRAGDDASMLFRILYQVEQCPGPRVANISRALGSHQRYVSQKMKRLVAEKQLVEIHGQYYLAKAALNISAYRDRVHVKRPRKRFGPLDDGLPGVARRGLHNEAVSRIVSAFRSHGFPVAGGWRGDDYSGGENATTPHAMIHMGDGSSIGAGWCYLQYVRQTLSSDGVADKLKGYIARGSKFPVLVVANEPTAAEFRRQAAAAGHPLWAASILSIRVDDPQNIAGEKTAWLDASGKPATLTPATFTPAFG